MSYELLSVNPTLGLVLYTNCYVGEDHYEKVIVDLVTGDLDCFKSSDDAGPALTKSLGTP